MVDYQMQMRPPVKTFLVVLTMELIDNILSEYGIEFLILKGAHLAHTVYDSPDERAYCDLDVLVRDRDFSQACKVFQAGGIKAVDKPQNEDDSYGLRYAEFVPVLVKALQEQQEIIDELKKRLSGLEQKYKE